ncbi:hypothetical protein [Natrinema halophilum]|uniref:Uncharacterized protein n=1 Tax=Natrinema halophilum TaxID=1699371 RepID=A0A7D5L373_9EURY|nr:hypothetical protein [Natrinema halophilum]QLG47905.1 DNA-packaging protein [Natrinema halophilum]
MTDEEICGYEGTTTGEPCRHPAGSCPVPSHSDDGAENPGRPSLFTDELAQEAVDAAREVYSYAGIERAIGVGEGTINSDGGWLDQDLTFTDADGNERPFSQALERARGEGERDLIRGGLYNEDMDTSMAKFLLASSYGHKKSEKREHEHSGPDGNPIEVTVNRERYESDE